MHKHIYVIPSNCNAAAGASKKFERAKKHAQVAKGSSVVPGFTLGTLPIEC